MLHRSQPKLGNKAKKLWKAYSVSSSKVSHGRKCDFKMFRSIGHLALCKGVSHTLPNALELPFSHGGVCLAPGSEYHVGIQYLCLLIICHMNKTYCTSFLANQAGPFTIPATAVDNHLSKQRLIKIPRADDYHMGQHHATTVSVPAARWI